MPNFCSFQIFEPRQTELVASLCKRVGWKVSFISDPSKRFTFSKYGYSELSHPSALATFDALREGENYGQLLVVEGKVAEANNIIQLIRAADLVLEGFPDQKYRTPSGFEIPKDALEQERIFKNVFRTTGFFELFSFMTERPVSVAMAANAWSDKGTVYAIHKLAKSYEIEAVTPWSTHPRYAQIFEKHSEEFSDHVRSSIAINLAFSAIEELSLQIKSSSTKPRWLDKEFTWNPAVLADITSRLEEAAIDPNRTINWIVRGDKTELSMQPVRQRFAAYGDGQVVRDIELSVPDAIHACSYLRNCMTAHAFSDKTKLIGPYQVFNVQQVARFLILSKCRLFNVWTNDLLEWQDSSI